MANTTQGAKPILREALRTWTDRTRTKRQLDGPLRKANHNKHPINYSANKNKWSGSK